MTAERSFALDEKLEMLRAVDVGSPTGQRLLTMALLDADFEVVAFAKQHMEAGSGELREDRALLCRIMEMDPHFALPTVLQFALGARGEGIPRYRDILLAMLDHDSSTTRSAAALEYLASVGVGDSSLRKSVRDWMTDQSIDSRRRLLAALALLGESHEDRMACEHLLRCLEVADPTARATSLGIIHSSGACARLPHAVLVSIAGDLDSVHEFSLGMFEEAVAPRSVGHLSFDCLRLARWDRDSYQAREEPDELIDLSGSALWHAWTVGGSFSERVATLGLSSPDMWVRLCALDLVERHELRSADVAVGLVRLLRSARCRDQAAGVLVSGCPHWLPQVAAVLSGAPDACTLAVLRALQNSESTADMLQMELQSCAETRNSAEVREIAAGLLTSPLR